MKYFILIFVISILDNSLICNAKAFSFAGIQWEDSRVVINDKLIKTKDFEGLQNRKGSHIEKALSLDADLVDSNKKLKFLNNKLESCKSEPLLQIFALPSVNNPRPIEERIVSPGNIPGEFVFSSFDDKLIYYIIDVNSTKKILLAKILEEKNGKPAVFEPNNHGTSWLAWETDNELMALLSTNSGGFSIIYINTGHLADLIEPCMKDENNDRFKANANKLF